LCALCLKYDVVQAIQKHPQTQVLVQASTPEVAAPPVQSPALAQQDASSKAHAEDDMPGVTSTTDFQKGVLTPARRLALMYRSQKKMLLWDVVLQG
jgi:hypothetical protein